MIPIKLERQESVLVAGNFSGDDIKALHTNPTLLSAKVSYIRNAVVNLYVQGYTTFVFTADGLFELLVATVINDFTAKGMNVVSVFVNPYPGKQYNGARRPEDFSHLSVCFCEKAEEFDPVAYYDFLGQNVNCVFSPSKIGHQPGYIRPEAHVFDMRIPSSGSTPN